MKLKLKLLSAIKKQAVLIAGLSSLPGVAAIADTQILGISAAGGEFGYIDTNTEINGVKQHTLSRGVYDYIYPSQEYIDYFVDEVGMNAIRIGARWERIQEVPGSAILDMDPRLLELVEVVERVTDSGAYAIIDIHNYGKFVTLNADGTEIETNIGDGPVTNEHFAYFWGRMAETFGDNPKVIFELMNEPNRQDQAKLMETLQAGIDAIQATGSTNTILVPGNRWSGAHSWRNADNYGASNATALLELTDRFGKLVFVAHQYLDQDYSGRKSDCISSDEVVSKLEVFTSWLRENSKRGLLGEFGVSSDDACLESLRAMLRHVDENQNLYLGSVYWATGDYWSSDTFYLIRPATLNNGQFENIGDQQLSVMKEFLESDDSIDPSPTGEILDQNATNAWYLPGDGRRAWINQGCADELEDAGLPRRTGTWNADLAPLAGYSTNCSAIPRPDDQDTEDPDEELTMGEVLDQNATNAWYLPGDGRRAWISQSCANQLQAAGLARRSGTWNEDLALLAGYSTNCTAIPRPDDLSVEPPMGEILDQNATNAWYLPGDGRRAWVHQTCADQLEAAGMPRRSGTWNEDLRSLNGFSTDCSKIQI